MLFERLRDTVPWRGERRQMYERVVDVPRLLAFYDQTMPLPDPVLVALKAALDRRYAPELGEPFATAGLCLYRDGRDSVAWHGDRIGRSSTEDTMVAIIVLGEPRAFLLRPRRGGATLRHDLGHGDLIVMGGSAQRTWEHAVPKSARPTGPRISIQFRPYDVALNAEGELDDAVPDLAGCDGTGRDQGPGRRCHDVARPRVPRGERLLDRARHRLRRCGEQLVVVGLPHRLLDRLRRLAVGRIRLVWTRSSCRLRSSRSGS